MADERIAKRTRWITSPIRNTAWTMRIHQAAWQRIGDIEGAR